jgi:hypothetical protein
LVNKNKKAIHTLESKLLASVNLGHEVVFLFLGRLRSLLGFDLFKGFTKGGRGDVAC